MVIFLEIIFVCAPICDIVFETINTLTMIIIIIAMFIYKINSFFQKVIGKLNFLFTRRKADHAETPVIVMVQTASSV